MSATRPDNGKWRVTYLTADGKLVILEVEAARAWMAVDKVLPSANAGPRLLNVERLP